MFNESTTFIIFCVNNVAPWSNVAYAITVALVIDESSIEKRVSGLILGYFCASVQIICNFWTLCFDWYYSVFFVIIVLYVLFIRVTYVSITLHEHRICHENYCALWNCEKENYSYEYSLRFKKLHFRTLWAASAVHVYEELFPSLSPYCVRPRALLPYMNYKI